jgi:DNA-binding CsgD family transcriptional regulator
MNLVETCSGVFSRYHDHIKLSNLPRHFYIMDQKGNALYYNDTCSAFLSSDSSLDLSNQFNTYDLIPVKEADQIKQNNLQVLQFQKEIIFQESFTYNNNETKTAISIKTPFRDMKRNLRGIIGISFIKIANTAVSGLKALTPNKIDCLYYLIKGYSYREMAIKMHLSARTIEHYIEELYDKYNCTKRHELISQALRIPEVQLKLFSYDL